VQCPTCKADLREGSKFCPECATPLPRACPACQQPNPNNSKFCSECGTGLTATGAPGLPVAGGEASSAEPRIGITPERRHLTIMFCDMVGSSALSTRLDPEEQREVVNAFQSCSAKEIKRFDGMVAQYLGDGVLAYFGYPAAHEDDAERAVRTALAILDAIGELKPASGVTLQARIGLASGVVVVGDLIGRSHARERGDRRDAKPGRAAAGCGIARRDRDRGQHAPAGGADV